MCAVLCYAVHDNILVMRRTCRSNWKICNTVQSCLQIRKLNCSGCGNKTKIFNGTVLNTRCGCVLKHLPLPNIDHTCFA